ncbi:MAG: hypothetical protein Athens071416_187 [Parcubacteria group bacterium Athens0714_16]|nr:MAG: hypothetical protein Athens071416_187 [Parcubacteria group bacterium Athens0714_16]
MSAEGGQTILIVNFSKKIYSTILHFEIYILHLSIYEVNTLGAGQSRLKFITDNKGCVRFPT